MGSLKALKSGGQSSKEPEALGVPFPLLMEMGGKKDCVIPIAEEMRTPGIGRDSENSFNCC